MGKKLSEMTLEELWELFPISLVEHKAEWKDYYLEMEDYLKRGLKNVFRISHIGSTAVKDIWSKDIVDILVEIEPSESLEKTADVIEELGFIRMSSSQSRISFNMGYTEKGLAEKVYHLHLRYAGDNDELYFRDYLNEHPECAKEYEQMKPELWKRFKHDRDGYTKAKTDFVKKCTEKAKKDFSGRYQPKSGSFCFPL